MNAHLRHKFACELFIGKKGFPPNLDWFPSPSEMEASKVLYMLNPTEFDAWLTMFWQRKYKLWKDMRDEPFHILFGFLEVNEK